MSSLPSEGSEAHQLLERVLAKARAALEERGDFNPLGAVVTSEGEARDYGGDAGVEYDDRKRIYLLMRAGFAEDALRGRIKAAALAVNAAVPAGVKTKYKQAVAVLVEAPGYAQRIFLPYRMKVRLPGAKKPPGAKFGELVPTDVKPFVFGES